MVVNYFFRVIHTAVTDLDVVSVEDFPELVVFGKCLSIRARNFCPMLVLVFFLKGGLFHRMLLRCRFLVCLFWLVHNVEHSGINFRRMLSGMEVQLGQRMLCQMIGTSVVC